MRLRDWPGFAGPLVHIPDPLSGTEAVVEALAAQFAPGHRVVSLEPRAGQPYQVHMADVLAALDQFGFAKPILVGEGLGCVAALLVAAWHPDHVARLVLIDPIYTAPVGSIEGRALSDCPPDWAGLRSAVQCPILEAADRQRLQTFVQIP